MTAPMFTEIDHVAIAVNDLEAAIKYYADVFGAEVDHREVVESDGVEEALLKVAESCGVAQPSMSALSSSSRGIDSK